MNSGPAAEVTRFRLHEAIETSRRLPRNVFRGKWFEFYFLDPDWIFSAEFVLVVREMLLLEEGTCALLTKLDRTGELRGAHFSFDISTEEQRYRSVLRGSGPCDGWIYDVGRFALIPSTGTWCIYTERDSEIAVFGLKTKEFAIRCAPILESVNASTIKDIVAGSGRYSFPDHSVSGEWRTQLLHEYGNESVGS